MKKSFVLLFAGLVLASNAYSACNDSLSASTPGARFAVDPANANIVLDKMTGLRWARCPVSYEWDESAKACLHDGVNVSTYTWFEALKMVHENEIYLNEQGWRLPNIKELASLIEYKCSNPSLNASIFKGSYPGSYWSNSHVAGTSSSIRVVNFYAGEVITTPETNENYLRLVKDADNTVE